jgi:hypothetical protein
MGRAKNVEIVAAGGESKEDQSGIAGRNGCARRKHADASSLSEFSRRPDGRLWHHLLMTTNWDYLLEREIDRMFPEGKPHWLKDSHVFHFNGTVEVPDNSSRSPFLLEDDPTQQRNQTPEGNIAFALMTWERVFVVVGMSFECETDKFLLSHLNKVQDDLPIGESRWVIVNPCRSVLDCVSLRIQKALPRATVSPVCRTFSGWHETWFLELETAGVFSR